MAIEKDLQGDGCEGSIHEFVWETDENHENVDQNNY
jgi:hypothetical protein